MAYVKVDRAAIRRFARQQVVFTRAELVERFGCSYTQARVLIRELEEAGIVRAAGRTVSRRFEYVPPPVGRVPAKRTPVEVEAASYLKATAGTQRGAPVAGVSGRARVRSTDGETAALLRACEDAGCVTERRGGGHIAIHTPEERMVVVAASPSDHRSVRNARALLRRMGVGV